MDLGAFDFRTGKMLMSKMNKSRQRVRYDSSNQVKVSAPALLHPVSGLEVTISDPRGGAGKRADSVIEFIFPGVEVIRIY